MPFGRIKPASPMASQMESADGDDLEITSETLPFILKTKMEGFAANANPEKILSSSTKRGRCALAFRLLPWLINIVLAVVVIVLAHDLGSRETPSHILGSDLMYSGLYCS